MITITLVLKDIEFIVAFNDSYLLRNDILPPGLLLMIDGESSDFQKFFSSWH